MNKCAVEFCMNARAGNPDKHFFTAPRSEERRRLWINAIGKQFSINTKFIVCEDHFDARNDVEFYRSNGVPVLMSSANPNRNLTKSEIKAHAKLNDTTKAKQGSIKSDGGSRKNPVTGSGKGRSAVKCSVVGCPTKKPNEEKYFFFCPRQDERRQLWIHATGKEYGLNSKFLICENHFDMRNDVEYFKVNGAPTLKKIAWPHRNLTQNEIQLQAKLDKLNWSCFVPSCGNQRLMADKKLVFFPIPEGQLGELWRSTIFNENFPNTDSPDRLQFCCEEHFDITKDLYKKFNAYGAVEYKIRDGSIPSLNLNASILGLGDEVKIAHLSDSSAHPRVILNNDISYLYGAKFPFLIEKLQMADDSAYVNMKDVKTETIELEDVLDIKTEVVTDLDTNPLDLDIKEEPQSDAEPMEEEESESETSSDENVDKDDPDVTSDDFSTSDDESTSESLDSLESSLDPESSDNGSEIDSSERFECSYCNKFVKKLDRHVERNHFDFSKNVNRTRCGLCLEQFTQRKDLKRHQANVHGGNSFGCDLCGCLTHRFGHLERHILRVHCEENELLCQQCGKGYKFIWELRRHIQNAHTERERAHECHLCPKKFYSKEMLSDHISSVHLDLRPYKCNADGCNKAFKLKKRLRIHYIQVHSNQKPHSCLICKKAFALRGNLTAHVKNVHKT